MGRSGHGPRTVLLVGMPSAVGRHLAARSLALAADVVLWGSEGGGPPLAESRLNGRDAIEAWYLCGRCRRAPGHGDHDAAEQLSGLLSAVRARGCVEVNLVHGARGPHAFGCTDASPGRPRPTGGGMVERCSELGIGWRVFRTAVVVDDDATSPGGDDDVLGRLLAVLDQFTSEVRERLPSYFAQQPLLCVAPSHGRVNLIRAGSAAALMFRVARQAGTVGRTYDIAHPGGMAFADVCARIGRVYGIRLLVVDERAPLNEIDRLFNDRLQSVRAYLASQPTFATEETYRTAGVSPREVRFHRSAQLRFFEAFRRDRDAERAARRGRVAAMPASLEERRIDREGLPLTYYACGNGGVPIVLLGALGHPLQFWFRLLDRLRERHSVLVWQPRGRVSGPRSLVSNEADDVAAVLQHARVGACYLVGWCTGPKVAAEFALRRPEAVSGMIFLNATFKHLASPAESETEYERKFEALCRAVDRRPSLAPAMLDVFRGGLVAAATSGCEGLDRDQAARHVLSLPSIDLRPHLLAPFANPHAVVDYSRQVLDFWAWDTAATAARVRRPVLLVAGEYDTVASPLMSRAAAQVFPIGRCVEVRGGNHYCMYDQPGVVEALIEDFIARQEASRPWTFETS